MRTRLSSLLTLLFLASAAPGWGQTPPATGEATTPSAAAPMAPAVDVVAIKEEASLPVMATKGRDAAGHDTLSVDFPDEEVRNILRNVADLFELNLVIPETLQGKASIKLRDVTWRQIFQVVLAPIGYSYIEEGNIIKVVSAETLQQEPVATEVFVINYARAADVMPTINTLVDAAVGGKIVVDARSNSLVITERPSRMVRIRPIIEQLDRATDQVMIETKFVEVTDGDIKNIGVNWASLKGYKMGVGPDPENNGVVGGYIRDTNSQTLTENSGGRKSSTGTSTGTDMSQTSGSSTKNIITSTNGTPGSSSETSINSGMTSSTNNGSTNSVTDTVNMLNSLTGTGSNRHLLNAVFTADQFGVVLSALNELTTAKVVSNPTVVTLNNTEAFINIGQEYPLPNYTYNEMQGTFAISGFTYRPIGIILKVTPQVNARGFIKLTIEPEVSSTNRSVTFGGSSGTQIPIIDTKKARTQISLKDGSTMGIGGLMDTKITNGDTKVPVLGSIPLLGRLFSSKSRSTTTQNLLIFLTARSVSAEGAPVEQVFDPRQIRQLNMKRDDLPGYRDGSDPFVTATPVSAEKKKSKWFRKKTTEAAKD
jgi:type IV pilus assembly protein PilQ